MEEPVLIGYFPKRTTVPDGWRSSGGLDHITEICSVSNCIASAPEGWIDRWLHNEFGFFNSLVDARTVLPAASGDFHFFGYRLLPRRFKKHRISALKISDPGVEPVGPAWQALGFDIVNQTATPWFECSPLSCNGLAKEVSGINRYCLVDTLDEAVSLAEQFSRHEPEPGPYFVIEVLRQQL